MSDIKTAETWADMKRPVVLLRKAMEAIPNPPVPDDGFGQKMNDLYRAVSGINETVDGRIAQEEGL